MVVGLEKTCRVLTHKLWPGPVIQRHLHGPRMLQEQGTPKPPKKAKLRLDAKVPRLIDKGVAQDIAHTLKPRLKQKLVFECCPGEGLLSEALLDVGVENLVLWEPQEKYWARLQDIEHRYEQVKLEKESFFQKKVPSKYDAEYMMPKKHPWNKAIQLQVVGVGHPKELGLWMARNAHAMATGTFPHHRGRTKLLLLVSGREHQLMVNRDDALGGMHGPVPVRVHDYQLYYRISTLLKIPKSALDGEVDYRSMIPKTATWDQNNYYLMEVSPRVDLFTTVCEKDLFTSFISFNQQLHRVRRANLVQRLEQWCPGLGLVALEMGYTMLDTVKHLQPKHLPLLFKEFEARGGLENLSFWTPHDDVHIKEAIPAVALKTETAVSALENTSGVESTETATLESLTVTPDYELKTKTKRIQKKMRGKSSKGKNESHPVNNLEEHTVGVESETWLPEALIHISEEKTVKTAKKTSKCATGQEKDSPQLKVAKHAVVVKSEPQIAEVPTLILEDKPGKKQKLVQKQSKDNSEQKSNSDQLNDAQNRPKDEPNKQLDGVLAVRAKKLSWYEAPLLAETISINKPGARKSNGYMEQVFPEAISESQGHTSQVGSPLQQHDTGTPHNQHRDNIMDKNPEREDKVDMRGGASTESPVSKRAPEQQPEKEELETYTKNNPFAKSPVSERIPTEHRAEGISAYTKDSLSTDSSVAERVPQPQLPKDELNDYTADSSSAGSSVFERVPQQQPIKEELKADIKDSPSTESPMSVKVFQQQLKQGEHAADIEHCPSQGSLVSNSIPDKHQKQAELTVVTSKNDMRSPVSVEAEIHTDSSKTSLSTTPKTNQEVTPLTSKSPEVFFEQDGHVGNVGKTENVDAIHSRSTGPSFHRKVCKTMNDDIGAEKVEGDKTESGAVGAEIIEAALEDLTRSETKQKPWWKSLFERW